MFKINGLEKEMTIDLDKSNDNSYTFVVESIRSDNGRHLPFCVDSNSNITNIHTSVSKINELNLTFNLEEIKHEEKLILKNYHKELYVINILPNKEASREKDYKFKLGKIISVGNNITINIISTENKRNIPWIIEYDGKPYRYETKATNTKLTANLITDIRDEFSSLFILRQEESNNKIRFNLLHKYDSNVEVVKIEAD